MYDQDARAFAVSLYLDHGFSYDEIAFLFRDSRKFMGDRPSGGVQGSASPPTRGSRWMTADLVQDAALDTDTVARVTTKLYSAARPPRTALHL